MGAFGAKWTSTSRQPALNPSKMSAGSLLLSHGRCGAYVGWRLAEAPAEHAIEMRNITKADRKRDINDR
jgi:hypothetical protein